jgi:hypothetical protein
MTGEVKSVPSISVSYARKGSSTKANALGMRPMQERAYEKRGDICSSSRRPRLLPSTSSKIRAFSRRSSSCRRKPSARAFKTNP